MTHWLPRFHSVGGTCIPRMALSGMRYAFVPVRVHLCLYNRHPTHTIGEQSVSTVPTIAVARSTLAPTRCYSQKTEAIDTVELSPLSTQTEIANVLRPHFEDQKPVLLKGINANHDAITNWKNLDYLIAAVGEDTHCTVEIGGSYSNADMERPDICFGDYIQYMKLFQERYESNADDEKVKVDQPNRKELVYLAQNDLFDPLRKDFTLPSLCSDPSFNVGKGSLYSTMFWFGPRGCISPLHYDPLDNLLMQFVGKKKVILFPAISASTCTENVNNAIGGATTDANTNLWHYAGHNGQQYNTSPIDLLNPDFEKFPLFVNAPTAICCDLEPGDICFIPQRWWHHVTSLDTSISVNAWWR
jgi:lysine-specific demethylase 8